MFNLILFYFIAHETKPAINECCNNIKIILLQDLFYFIINQTTLLRSKVMNIQSMSTALRDKPRLGRRRSHKNKRPKHSTTKSSNYVLYLIKQSADYRDRAKIKKVKSNILPYLLPSVGPEADPGVEAVSL